MPVIPSSYQAPFFLRGRHLQTIIPALFRKVQGVAYRRERLPTADADFLDLDWSVKGNKKLAIVSHGLEGDTGRPYMLGMVKALNANSFDVLAWNFRGCSGEINKQLRFYHSGATEDLEAVIDHALQQAPYTEIVLVGFSLGGNLTLKYIGERGSSIRPKIKQAVVFSVPCDLAGACWQISKRGNYIYSSRFLKNLTQKVLNKAKLMPDLLSVEHLQHIKTIRDFDDFYTAPLHGYKDADTYYEQCSSIRFIPMISIPTLIINAQNDPFLSPSCYPIDLCLNHPFVSLEMPAEGGHCGFYTNSKDGIYWSEQRAVEFLLEHKLLRK